MSEAAMTLGALLGWEDVGAGRRLIHCRRCTSPIELRLMDDLLEVACPGCGAQPVFEAFRDLELDAGWESAQAALLELGVVDADEAASALEAAGGAPVVSSDDARTGLVGAARALGFFRKSLYLSSGDGDGAQLRPRALEELVQDEHLAEAVELECTNGVPSGEVIAALVLAGEKEKQYGDAEAIETVDLDGLEVAPEVVQMVPAGLAASYLVVPVRLDDERLVVAVRDPLDYELIDNLKFLVGREVRTVAAPEDALLRALERLFPDEDLRDGALPDPDAEPGELALLDDEPAHAEPSAEELTAAGMPHEPPGERTLNLLLLQVAEERASGMILEPLEVTWRVRLRRGGRLRDVALLERDIGEAVVKHTMVRAGLDPERCSVPQTGTIDIKLGGEGMRFHVATARSTFGPVVALTEAPQGFRSLGLDALALLPADAELLRTLRRTEPGLVLVAGPAGAGKSTLLYGLFREADRAREHIAVLERSSGARVEGVTQLEADDFSKLSPLLRVAEPDRVFCDDVLGDPGSARARDEVRMLLDLALGGARVVTAVPGDDALDAVARLAATGIDVRLLAHALRAVVGVRVVQRICARCREEFEPDDALRERLGLGGETRRLSVGIGCWECAGTGYSGRAALVELIPVSASRALRDAVAALDPEALGDAAEGAGAATLRVKALRALRAGLTSVSEVRGLL
jgi:type IV pilus assembly protein PilB